MQQGLTPRQRRRHKPPQSSRKLPVRDFLVVLTLVPASSPKTVDEGMHGGPAFCIGDEYFLGFIFSRRDLHLESDVQLFTLPVASENRKTCLFRKLFYRFSRNRYIM